MTERNDTIDITLKSLRMIATVSAVYIAVIITALFLQYRQMQKISLIDFPQMQQLKEMVKTDSDNLELKQRIRNIDLLARRTWFSGLEQLHVGGILLTGGIIVLLLSLGGMRLLTGPLKPKCKTEEPRELAPKTSILLLSTMSVSIILIMIILMIRASSKDDIFKNFSITNSSIDLSASTLSLDAVNSDIQSSETKKPSDIFSQQLFMDNWPQFRGPRGNGLTLHPVDLKWDIETDRGIKWKIEIPLPGFSSPLVWQDYIFLTGGNKQKRTLFAYDANNGTLLWQADTRNIPGSPLKLPSVTDDTGYAAATPATNGRQICSMFGSGNVLCTDFQGNRLWAKNMGVPENHYGYSSSLLLIQNRLIIQFDNNDHQIIYCLDPATGNVLWQNRRDSAISWASPMHLQTEGKSLIVVVNSQHVQAYHLETGEQAWSIDCMGGEVASSPTYDQGRIFVASEFANAFAIDAQKGEVLWKTNEPYLPSVSSPIVYNNLLFLFSTSISCLDASTGDLLWEQDMEDEFYSSPLLVQDRILIFNVKGSMFVLKPDREKLIIEDQIPLKEAVVSTPALANGSMWIRGIKHLYCIQSRSSENESR